MKGSLDPGGKLNTVFIGRLVKLFGQCFHS